MPRSKAYVAKCADDTAAAIGLMRLIGRVGNEHPPREREDCDADDASKAGIQRRA
jgi:hypothetical protein